MFGRTELDDMIAFAREELLSGHQDRKRSMIKTMAERWPDQPALSLVYAVTSATEAIEESTQRRSKEAEEAVPHGYRLSALVSADVHAVQSMGLNPPRAEDLLHFWRRVDPHFLRVR